MKPILIIVRTEADFERAIAIGIAAKKNYKLHFIFVGDFSPFYYDGIQNKFQKELFKLSGFKIQDFSEFDLLGKILRKLSRTQCISFDKVRDNKNYLFAFLFFRLFNRYISIRNKQIVKNIFNKIDPVLLLTDQSLTIANYLPEQIRAEAIKRNIPAYIFSHGAAGGLHSAFSNPTFESYNNCTVFVCNKNETRPEIKNRVILGDIRYSYQYVHFINKLNYYDLDFLNNRKHRIAFLIGGVLQAFTSTNGWSIHEEILIELSDKEDVAMILKLHPREARFLDLRMLKTFTNLKIVSNETDTSRVVKWADIVICNDHCSTVFEPMILGKKVVVIEGKHIPEYKNNHSPLKDSSATFITHSSQFNLENLPVVDPFDKITDKIAWGENGSIDIACLLIKYIEEKI